MENVRLNKLTNVQAFQLALSDQDGSAILQIADVAGAGRIVDPSEHSPMPAEHVKIVHGDRFIQSRGLRFPRAVKIDVEGHEYSVLSGLSRTLSQPSSELVCCEVHPRFLPGGLKADDVLALLRSMGFTEIESHSRADDLHVWASKHA
jgi:FkbM family methyltransferase